jgi:hypothetical protein
LPRQWCTREKPAGDDPEVITMCALRFLRSRCDFALITAAVIGLLAVPVSGVADPPQTISETQILGYGDYSSFGNEFGAAVDVSGNVIFVGDPLRNAYSGAVYVYEREMVGPWSPLQRIDGEWDATLGAAVAIDGGRALVGVPVRGWYFVPVGVVLEYLQQADGTWIQVGRIDTPADATQFGRDVAFNDGTAVVSAEGWESNPEVVIVYEKIAGGWQEVYRWTGSSRALAVQGTTILIGDPGYDGAGENTGAVHELRRNDQGLWQAAGLIVADNETPGARFGTSVAMDGPRVLVGSDGAAYVFEFGQPDGWTQRQRIVAPEPGLVETFGTPVALDNRIAVVAASEAEDPQTGHQPGKGYVFVRNAAGNWALRAILETTDRAGFREMRMDGGYLAVGDRQQSESQDPGEYWPVGAAYAFDLSALHGPLDVSIDVKPGNARNVINPARKGRLWVAILSDEAFDALQVDPGTVELGPGAAKADRFRVKDVNRDRMPDLVLRFRTPDVGLQCGDTELELTAETFAGESVIGTDAVSTVGCKKPQKGTKR